MKNKNIDAHWAIISVGDPKTRKEILESDSIENFNRMLVKQLETAYCIVAIENMKISLNEPENRSMLEQFTDASKIDFKLKRLIEPQIKGTNIDFILKFLQLSLIGYCGESEEELKKLFDENDSRIEKIKNSDEYNWKNRILTTIFTCWIGLIKGEAKEIPKLIANIKKEQKLYEPDFLDSKEKAIDLVCFYNLTKATELIAEYILNKKTKDVRKKLEDYFFAAINAAEQNFNLDSAILIRWMIASADKMITKNYRKAHILNYGYIGKVETSTIIGEIVRDNFIAPSPLGVGSISSEKRENK